MMIKNRVPLVNSVFLLFSTHEIVMLGFYLWINVQSNR
jgi:hypothetical protein